MENKLTLDPGQALKDVIELYKKHFVLLLIGMLLALGVGALSLGFLSSLMMAGTVLVALELVRKQDPIPDVKRYFAGFERFVEFFLYGLVWFFGLGLVISLLMFIPCLGNILGTILSLVAVFALFFALPLMWDRGMGFWDASMASIALFKENPVPISIFVFVAWLVSASGLILCGIGVLFTGPIFPLMVAYAYQQIKDHPALEAALGKPVTVNTEVSG